MRNAFLKLYVKAEVMLATMKKDEGQDLVEYALVVALIALAATTGMKSLANAINGAFTTVGTSLNTYV